MARAIDEPPLSERSERLAEKLCEIRARLNLSQRQMLDLLGRSDHHHAFVSMWERGHREPPLITVLRYARSIGVSMDVLVDDDLDLPSRKSPAVKRRKRTRKAK
jgi:transcriptional regulator with XRE-family HTH domain